MPKECTKKFLLEAPKILWGRDSLSGTAAEGLKKIRERFAKRGVAVSVLAGGRGLDDAEFVATLGSVAGGKIEVTVTGENVQAHLATVSAECGAVMKSIESSLSIPWEGKD